MTTPTTCLSVDRPGQGQEICEPCRLVHDGAMTMNTSILGHPLFVTTVNENGNQRFRRGDSRTCARGGMHLVWKVIS